jgi:thymidine phosphorylase
MNRATKDAMNSIPHKRTGNTLRLRRLGIDTYYEPVIFMRKDCHICRSEGFESRSRVLVRCRDRTVIATLNVVTTDLLSENEASLSESAWTLLDAREGDEVALSHPDPVVSLSHVRAKIYGKRVDDAGMTAIVRDIADRKYADIHLAAFLTACAGDRLDTGETAALTKAMIAVGRHISWGRTPIVDKHCVGGLPGNRTTPIVVAIVAAHGLTIPKTSSRAITSPAGTADTMETLAPVMLDAQAMRRVVEREGGCIVWGGAVQLSPADDILIRVERPLDLDSEGQMVASILSKKAAAGSSHVIVDMPVGATAKVRSTEAAQSLRTLMTEVGRAVSLEVCVVITDGSQPVGRGIGPALEARDVLAVLQGKHEAPRDLRDRAATLAGQIIEFAGNALPGMGIALAYDLLADGRAWRKFQAICEAQGGMRTPPRAAHTHAVPAIVAGRVVGIDNRRLARAAKLAGAPRAPAAGLELHTPLGARVERGQPLFTLHAEAPGELAYALEYLRSQPPIIDIEAS